MSGRHRRQESLSERRGSLPQVKIGGSSAALLPPSPQKRLTVTPRDAYLGAQLQGIVPLLNNPRESPAGASTWFANPFGGDPFPETPPPLAPGLLPDVDIRQFQRYLKHEAVEFEQFQSARADSGDGAKPVAASEGQAGHGEGLVRAMRKVPALFFQERFSLSRPETWEDVAPSDSEEQRAEALDQLSAHLDVVEVHLLAEISAKRENFFEAAGALAECRASLRDTFDAITALRHHVGSMEADSGHAVEELARLTRRRDNLAALVDRLSVLDGLSAGAAALGLLLEGGDYGAALDVLADLQAGLAGDPLRGLACFRQLPDQIAEAGASMNELIAADFLRATAFTGLDAAADDVLDALRRAHRSGLAGTAEGALAAFASAGEQPEHAGAQKAAADGELAGLVACLRRMGRLPEALAAARDAAGAEVKQAIREVVERGLPVLLGKGFSEGAPLAEQLQALQPWESLALLAAVHAATRACLTHRRRVRAALAEALRAGRASRAEVQSAVSGAADALQAASDAAHGRWAKLLAARAVVHAQAELPELREVLALSEALASLAEGEGVRPAPGLRSALQQQCRAWLDALHSRSMARLNGRLDKETWAAAPVTADVQTIVDDLAARSAADARLPASKGQPADGAAAANGHSTDRLRIGGEAFVMVGVGLEAVRLVAAYLHFQAEVPDFSGDVARRVIQLLQVFNSRTCQLVLGAGAMATAGLRSITAKHLALSAQAAGAIIALHPLLRGGLAAPVPHARRALLSPDFDRLLQDLTVHRAEVHSKLVGIMRERLNASLKGLPAAADAWAAGAAPGPGSPPPPPSAFAASNAKQLRILSQVLAPLLGPSELASIFGRVAQVFASSLAEAFQRLQPQGPAWRAQATADIAALLAALQGLPQGGTAGRAAALSPLSSLLAPGAPFSQQQPQQPQSPPQQQQQQQQPQSPKAGRPGAAGRHWQPEPAGNGSVARGMSSAPQRAADDAVPGNSAATAEYSADVGAPAADLDHPLQLPNGKAPARAPQQQQPQSELVRQQAGSTGNAKAGEHLARLQMAADPDDGTAVADAAVSSPLAGVPEGPVAVAAADVEALDAAQSSSAAGAHTAEPADQQQALAGNAVLDATAEPTQATCQLEEASDAVTAPPTAAADLNQGLDTASDEAEAMPPDATFGPTAQSDAEQPGDTQMDAGAAAADEGDSGANATAAAAADAASGANADAEATAAAVREAGAQPAVAADPRLAAFASATEQREQQHEQLATEPGIFVGDDPLAARAAAGEVAASSENVAPGIAAAADDATPAADGLATDVVADGGGLTASKLDGREAVQGAEVAQLGESLNAELKAEAPLSSVLDVEGEAVARSGPGDSLL